MSQSLPHLPQSPSRLSHFAPWLLIALICLRFAFVSQYVGQLADDPDMYRGISDWFMDGYGFARPDTGHPTAYRPPLYPLLLAAFREANSLIAILHLLLGVAMVWLTWKAANRFGGHSLDDRRKNSELFSTRSRDSTPASIVVTALVAIDPLLIQNSTLVMTETLAAFLVSLLLWFVARGVTTWRRAVLLGIVFGLCCLCRPTFWAFGGLAALIWLVGQFMTRHTAATALPLPLGERGEICVQATNNSHGQILEGFRSQRIALCVCIGTLVTVAPWAIRNLVVFGRPIVTTTHGGYTLLLGHNPVYYREVVEQPWGAVWSGESLTAWQGSLEAAIRADGVSPNDEVARDRWMYQQAWGNIANDPGLAVRAGLTLLGRFWNVVPMSTEERSLPSVLRWGIGVFYVAVFVAMGLGVWRLTREEWSRWWPLVALIVSFTCVHALYWADMRMRAPLVPAIALLAARGLGTCPRTTS